MTKVISLFAGSGAGKSTTAAGLFYEMKKLGLEVELINEYVKKWAWEGKKVGPYDQVYLFGKQAKSEYELYGKVDYIITDSPILLSAIYERFYSPHEAILTDAIMGHIGKAEQNGVEFRNYVLNRTKPFNPKGRYETEEMAKKVDKFVRRFLTDQAVSYKEITSIEQDDKVKEILLDLGVIK